MPKIPSKSTIFIASPLESEHVARIRALDPERVEVIYEPDLLPPTRYLADHIGHPFVRTAEQEKRWRDALGRADILWDLPRRPEDMAFARRVRWIQSTSTGVGQSIKSLGLQSSDVLITTARGVHAGPLAEFVFMVLLAQWRGLARLQAEQRLHRWIRYCGEEVAGRRIALIGAGDLSRGVAERARSFGIVTVALARDPARERAHNGLFDTIAPIADLLKVVAASDATVVTVPHTPETERLIGRSAFAAMKPGSIFINIARGQVADEQALIEHLRNGHLGFAALDVAPTEPLPPDNPLWDLPNVLISPHSASTVAGENRKIIEIFLWNLRCWLDHDLTRMRNVLDKRLMY
ncbi:MAG: D-2-hydroxyacid dehydrogenase [Acetobacteraceae bacterium]